MPIIVAYQQTAALDSAIYRAGRHMSYCKRVLLIIKWQQLSFLLYLKKLETRSKKNFFFIYIYEIYFLYVCTEKNLLQILSEKKM